jgi:hypothetical protein
MWWSLQDGALPHPLLTARQRLNPTFALGEPVNWRSPSPDFNPPDLSYKMGPRVEVGKNCH